MSTTAEAIRYIPWRKSQHPTFLLMAQTLQEEGMRPYKLQLSGNARRGAQSHGFTKAIYCVEGKVEVVLPDSRGRVILNVGDRLDIGAGVRHSLAVGIHGALLLEGTPSRLSRA